MLCYGVDQAAPGGGSTRVSVMVELRDRRGTPLWAEDRNV